MPEGFELQFYADGPNYLFAIKDTRDACHYAIFANQDELIERTTQQGKIPSPVDYETFWKQDLQGRLRLFNAITPENRAEIVRTHAQRWLDANRARLTSEQITLMDENVACITADLYRLPRSEALMVKANELETRTAAIFSREDTRNAMTIYGPYIPKK